MRRGIGTRCAVIVGIMLALVGVIASVGVVRALDDDKLLEYSLNSIMFYDGDCTSSGGASAECGITVSGSTIEEKIWSGLTSFMTEEQAAGVMGNLRAESGLNPARHEDSWYDRNSNFPIMTNTEDSYGVGLVQWSFGRRVNMLKYIKEKAPELLEKYIDAGRSTYHKLSGEDFLKQAGDADTDLLIALQLCFLKQELEGDKTYGGILNQNTVAEASWYFLDKVESPDDKLGKKSEREGYSLEYYNQLKGKTFSSSGRAGSGGGGSLPSCSGGGNNNIAQTAIELAWPKGTSKSTFKEKEYEPFKKAADEVHIADKKYCHNFVATVVRYSGYDKSFPPTISRDNSKGKDQREYVRSHSDLWELIPNWYGDKSKLKVGDIVSWKEGDSQHTFIIIDIDGELKKAESACGWACAKDNHGRGKTGSWGHITNLGKEGCQKSSRHCWIIRPKKATSGTSTVTGEIVNSGQGNGDIGASALALAWKEGTAKGTYQKKATDAFKEYFNSLSQAAADKGTCYAGGKSCDRFVATVVRYAGVDDKMSFGPVAGGTLPYLEGSSDWEEVNVGRDLDKYQSGDVLIFYKNGIAKHTAIYAVDSGGDGHVVQASNCDYYGVVKNTNAITGNYWEKIRVFRNKNNKNGGAEKCDLCSKSSSTGLVAGGMDLAKANTFMKGYHDKAMKEYFKKQIDVTFEGAKIRNAGCPYGVMNNCVAFSQWFLNRYTTIGPNWNNTTDGKLMVQKLASTQGLPTGTEPRPYAIFSTSQWGSAGHTGVVLGVNTATQKIIVGEAACSQSAGHLQYEPRAWEYTFDYIQKNGWTFAYTDSILKEGGL